MFNQKNSGVLAFNQKKSKFNGVSLEKQQRERHLTGRKAAEPYLTQKRAGLVALNWKKTEVSGNKPLKKRR